MRLATGRVTFGRASRRHARRGYHRVVEPERAKQLLAEERRRIESALEHLRRADVGELAGQDEPADRASELYADELDEGISEGLREALAAIERAEARLEQGTYGLSVESGEPIPDERLEAFPTAERTIEEQRQHDRGNG
jgi:DnaK suppressor protein